MGQGRRRRRHQAETDVALRMTADPDVRLNHVVEGSGARNLVLLHELGGTLHSFDDLVPLLADDFRILRYDQRGCGFVSDAARAISVRRACARSRTIAERGRLEATFVMAGFAAGSAIAVAFALRHPNAIAALALCAPALAVDADRRIYLAERSALVAREGMDAVVEDTLARSYPPQFRKSDPARFESYRTHFLANDPVGYGYLNMAFADVALIDSLGALKTPCLMVAGEHDPLRPPEQVRKLAARIAGAQDAPSSTPAISWRCTRRTSWRGRLRAFFK